MDLLFRKRLIVGIALAAITGTASILGGCGGGDGNAIEDDSGIAKGSSATPVLTGPYDNRRYIICGQEVAPNSLRGKVLSVYDGDTITISGSPASLNIRLEGIDAPEVAQSFGVESRDALRSALLGKDVIVAHKANDQYGRVIGSVFTQECLYANLDQLNKGLAWFYRAYQCELNLPQRTQFQEAEQKAAQARQGLWSQSEPVAPWQFRNGTTPATPTCSSDWAKLSAPSAMPGADLSPPTVAGNTGSGNADSGAAGGGGTSGSGTGGTGGGGAFRWYAEPRELARRWQVATRPSCTFANAVWPIWMETVTVHLARHSADLDRFFAIEGHSVQRVTQHGITLLARWVGRCND